MLMFISVARTEARLIQIDIEIKKALQKGNVVSSIHELCHKKTCLYAFQPGPTKPDCSATLAS